MLQAALTAGAMARAVLALAVYREVVHGVVPFGLTPGDLAQLAAPKPEAESDGDLREDALSSTIPEHGHGRS